MDRDDLIFSMRKNSYIDPETFEYIGPSEEEKEWICIKADGPKNNILEIGKWLYDRNIKDWYWKDRDPTRMVNRINLYFKNEKDLTIFLLGWEP
ncbi:MAG: hypothetical protein ACHQIM_21900 [Sphingobacteriales bacterium]